MITRRIFVAGLLLASAIAGPSGAHDYKAGTIAINHPWARATPAGAPVAGGYLTLTNNGTETDTLIGGRSAFASAVEIHESTTVDGVARMRQLTDGVEIAPGHKVELAPGAIHMMFIKPARQLKEGEKFPVTLRFLKAGEVNVDFAVQTMGTKPPAAAEQNHQHHGTSP